MADILFYDEQEFDARTYAQAFDMICTKLGLSLSKGYISPSRHDYGMVYFLVSERREHYLSPSLIPMPRFAGFRFRENCLIIKAGLFQNYEKNSESEASLHPLLTLTITRRSKRC